MLPCQFIKRIKKLPHDTTIGFFFPLFYLVFNPNLSFFVIDFNLQGVECMVDWSFE
jgi:hypothetical protein